MDTRLTRILITLTLLAAALSGCLPAGGGQPADDGSAAAIATSVAATMAAAGAPENGAAEPAPTSTVQVPETSAPPEPDMVYHGVSFAYDHSLAADVSPSVLAAVSDEGGPWWSTPEIVAFVFNGYTLPGAFLDARIYVYDVAAFTAINPTVGERLATLRQVLDAGDVNDDRIAMADLFNAGQMLRTKVAFVNFQNGSGVRFLSQYGQALSAVGWPHMFYGFQGLTADGQYFISAVMPVSHISLPAPDTVTIDDAFIANFENYVAQNEAALQAQADESFQPSLILLDQLVGSIRVEPH